MNSCYIINNAYDMKSEMYWRDIIRFYVHYIGYIIIIIIFSPFSQVRCKFAIKSFENSTKMSTDVKNIYTYLFIYNSHIIAKIKKKKKLKIK